MTAGTFDLVMPDWGGIDTVRRSPLPFALWTVGDQCLLHHWFDHAVNQGATAVRVFAADRPAEVRRVIRDSILWPLEIEFVAVASVADAPAGARQVDWLPDGESPSPPVDGWDLVARIAGAESAWLERLAAEPDYELLSIGFSCRIHPEAKLTAPFFIGDHVFIGPGCEIGPHAVIGEGSVIAGANRISNAHVSAHSYLGPVTALENGRLESGILLNLAHKARLDELEPHLLSSLKSPVPVVPLGDRLRALWMYLRFPKSGASASTFTTFDGRVLPGSPGGGLEERRSWLPFVWRGKLPLYGVLPRSREQFERLIPDWQNVIRHASVGVFSYADSQGCHSPDNPEEAIHAVYQASLPPGALAGAISGFVRNLISSDPPRPLPP